MREVVTSLLVICLLHARIVAAYWQHSARRWRRSLRARLHRCLTILCAYTGTSLSYALTQVPHCPMRLHRYLAMRLHRCLAMRLHRYLAMRLHRCLAIVRSRCVSLTVRCQVYKITCPRAAAVVTPTVILAMVLLAMTLLLLTLLMVHV